MSDIKFLIDELQKETGLLIDLPDGTDQDVAIKKLKQLLAACHRSDEKEDLLKSLLTQDNSEEWLQHTARALHADPSASYAVYLIYLPKNKKPDPSEILRGLYCHAAGDFLFPLNDSTIAFIQKLSATVSYHELHETAESLLDTLNTGLMLEALISYGMPANHFFEIRRSFNEAETALDIGMTFSAKEYIFGYDQLGMKRLIYDLPASTCRAYLMEIFHGNPPERIDEEVILTARAFFENGLNISDTAKQLFIHRNTLIYRLDKLHKATGLDIRNFEDAMTFRNVVLIYERIYYQQH